MDLSVVIPVYNGEKTLPELYRRLKKALEGKFIYEILLIYDAGKDNSWSIIQKLKDSDPFIVKCFRLKQNYGQHRAILFGMTKAQGDYIITLDEDLQHDPEYIKDLITEQKRGDYDVVYAKFDKLKHPGIRVRTSEMLRKTLTVFVPGLYPYYSPYRLVKKEITGKISEFRNSYTFIDGYIGWTTGKISNVPVMHFKRGDGESSYTYLKLAKHAIYIIIAYSKIKIWLLLPSLLLNLTAIGLFNFNRIRNISITGKTTVVLFSAGIFFLFLAFLTEILHHWFLRRNSRPVESL